MSLRAYYYFLLVNLYAMPYNCAGTTPESLLGVPLVIKPEIRDEGIARNTVAEVNTQICKDIVVCWMEKQVTRSDCSVLIM